MKKLIIFLFFIAVCLFLYGKYLEPTQLEVKEYTLESEKLPIGFNGTKIVHFSDLLYKNNDDLEKLKKLVVLINEQNPDIIFFTGDLINKDISSDEAKTIEDELNKLNANLYKYAISGDKDNDKSIDILKNTNFIYLNNESSYLFNEDNNPILILGGNDLNEESLLKDENITYDFILTLIHKPDYYDQIKDLNSTFVFAGHSLGGEINVPFWGPLLKEEGSKKYNLEHYNLDNTDLYISNGIGTGKTTVRIFNKPSINVYRLISK